MRCISASIIRETVHRPKDMHLRQYRLNPLGIGSCCNVKAPKPAVVRLFMSSRAVLYLRCMGSRILKTPFQSAASMQDIAAAEVVLDWWELLVPRFRNRMQLGKKKRGVCCACATCSGLYPVLGFARTCMRYMRGQGFAFNDERPAAASSCRGIIPSVLVSYAVTPLSRVSNILCSYSQT